MLYIKFHFEVGDRVRVNAPEFTVHGRTGTIVEIISDFDDDDTGYLYPATFYLIMDQPEGSVQLHFPARWDELILLAEE